MTKFFRVICNLLLICYILVAAAIFVPPLVGVTTAVTFENTHGNQTVGTVDYAMRTPIDQLSVGDKILVTDIDEVNVYTVTAVDQTTPAISVAETQEPVSIRTHAQKMLIAVPYIGYLAALLQTTEGILILAGVAAGLLILCIIFGIVCRKKAKRRTEDDYEEEDEDEDDQFYRNLAEQKIESDAKAEIDFAAKQASRNEQIQGSGVEAALDEEYEELRDEEMISDEAEQQNGRLSDDEVFDDAADQPAILSEENQDSGYTEYSENQEIVENQETEEEPDDSETGEIESADNTLEMTEDIPEEAGQNEYEEISDQDASDHTGNMADEEPDKEPDKELTAEVNEEADAEMNPDEPEQALIPEELEEAEVSIEEPVIRTGNIPGVQAALEAALSTQQIQHHARRTAPVVETDEVAEPEQAEEIELAMPLRTADEYLQKAYAQGDDPAVVKDELTGVTFIDYSECI